MTELTIYADEASPRSLAHETDHAKIAEILRDLGVELRLWPTVDRIQPGAEAKDVLAAYAEPISALKSEFGFESVDVVSMGPDHPARVEARQKFLAEHTHADYEMRFFVAGGGMFYIRQGARVFLLLCTAGDLISVPAGMPHWFDMSESPNFVAIRFFTTADGWVAKFTGDDIAERYPEMSPLGE